MDKSKRNINNEIKKELIDLANSVDYNSINTALKNANVESIEVGKQTLLNIAKWCLNGDSYEDIRNNLELNRREWALLIKNCPAILIVMQRSYAYAELVIGGTLFQTAIGGNTIKKKMPLKVKDYVDGKVVGEHYEIVEWDEVQPPNPYLLKFLTEKKLNEKLGGKPVDNSKKHAKIIEKMPLEEAEALANSVIDTPNDEEEED